MATFEKRVGKSGKSTWRVRVRKQNGPALTKSFARKIDAEEWARSIEHKLDVGEHVPSSEARKRTLADAIDRYLTVTLPHSKHRKNASEQERLLNWWRVKLGSRPLVSVTPAVIAEIRDQLTKVKVGNKMLSGATINRRITALSAALSVTVKEYGWLQKNPAANVTRLQDSKGRERFLSDTERLALLEACDASACVPLSTVVRLALATGARKGELMGLQWAGVDLDRRTVRFLDTKNGESRTVPLAEVAVTVLKEWGRDRLKVGPVFPREVVRRQNKGARAEVPMSEIDVAWREARHKAKLDDVRFHDLRHSAASYLAMSGASLMDIAAILGHKTLAMVKRYSHLSEQHTSAAMDRMAEKFLR